MNQITSNEFADIEKRAYDRVYDSAMEQMKKGFFLNPKACKSNIKRITMSMRVLEEGAIIFSTNVQEADKANAILADKRGRVNAYKALLTWYNQKLKEHDTDR